MRCPAQRCGALRFTAAIPPAYRPTLPNNSGVSPIGELCGQPQYRAPVRVEYLLPHRPRIVPNVPPARGGATSFTRLGFTHKHGAPVRGG